MDPPTSRTKSTSTRRRLTKCMTPAQLERKRKADRENQRAIRARTKAHAENLEQLVQHLTERLEESQVQVTALTRDNERIQVALNSYRQAVEYGVRSSTQPFAVGWQNEAQPRNDGILHGGGEADSALGSHILRQSESHNTLKALQTQALQETLDLDTSISQDLVIEVGANTQEQWNETENQCARWQSDGELEPSSELPTAAISPTIFSVDDEDEESKELSGLHDLVSSLIRPPLTQETPLWAVTPNVSAPTCCWDRILAEMVSQSAQIKAKDLIAEISSPIGVIVSSALSPTTAPQNFPLFSVIARRMHSYFNKTLVNDMTYFPAVLYIVYTMIRWRTIPSQENYNHIPTWMKPTKLQLQFPHAAWMDTFPWPKGRSKLIEFSDYSGYHSFRAYCTNSVSINWPYDIGSILAQCPLTNRVTLNPVYEQHIMNLENWTAMKSMVQSFPMIAGMVNESSGVIN